LDYSALRGLIRTHYPTNAAFAKALGISECALSQKLNNRTEWTRREMAKAAELLQFSVAAIPIYFFTPLVEKTQQGA
jgi:transcriptional regulator with XRE-family HTH domain